ncbi:hypothetical protein ACFY8X_38990 [Streptomyces tanashiensis]|uniref:hypothetical protein n=1 Tax=Streptomyces tanashiensis TaxID=67367 RepID=UPI0036DFE0E7
MTQPSPADELRAAAEKLRHPRAAEQHGPALAIALAQWLDSAASHLDVNTHPGWQEAVAGRPIAVARAINGDTP